jgi:hypothetical protein
MGDYRLSNCLVTSPRSQLVHIGSGVEHLEG